MMGGKVKPGQWKEFMAGDFLERSMVSIHPPSVVSPRKREEKGLLGGLRLRSFDATKTRKRGCMAFIAAQSEKSP